MFGDVAPAVISDAAPPRPRLGRGRRILTEHSVLGAQVFDF